MGPRMSRMGTIKTTAITVSAAFGIGFIMQYGQSPAEAPAVVEDRQDLKAGRISRMAKNAKGESVFGVPNIVTAPLDHASNQRAIVAVDAVYAELAVPQMGAILATPVAGCRATLSAVTTEAAMVTLFLSAPCEQDEDFLLRHEALEFTARTDDQGKASIVMPALAVSSTFTALFDNIEQASVVLNVPAVRMYDRAVLQWDGNYNLQLHALEAGAGIGDPGHVWSASVHTSEDAVAGEQGFVVRLGTPDADWPKLAEVYTYPAGHTKSDGQTVLQISAVVTETNCGREVDTRTIHTAMGGPLDVRKVGAALPGCDAVGQVTVLQGKFDDITLASR